MTKGILIIRNSDGQAVLGASGKIADIDAWRASQHQIDWTQHHYHEVPLEEYKLRYAGRVHQVSKRRGQLHVRDHNHAERRNSDYPPIVDQLDMLWHAMHNGEIPKSSEFYDAIKKVKDKHPKSS